MSDRRLLDDLRREALDAARGLFEGEQALVAALAGISEERSRAAEAYGAVVRSLAVALSARDGYTGEHSDIVRDLAVAVGSATRARRESARRGRGRRASPRRREDRDPRCDPPQAGPARRRGVGADARAPRDRRADPAPLPGLADVARAVRHEHERWDGRGYPDGLAGEEIPLASRIVLACDAFNALVSDRPYRRALSRRRGRSPSSSAAPGTQFDPDGGGGAPRPRPRRAARRGRRPSSPTCPISSRRLTATATPGASSVSCTR